MKNKLLLITIALALPAAAGTAYESPSAPAPAPQSSLWSWFIGGSAGYLVDAEEGYYAGQLGVDTPWSVGGWNVALYGEVGFSQFDNRDFDQSPVPMAVDIDTDMVAATFNVKLERPLTGNLNAYVGAGLGMAFLDISATSAAVANNVNDDENLFTASVFGGLVYNVSEAFEVFGGARWMYLDDVDVRGFDTGSGDDWLFEGGLRFNF
jgi:opacity protein-like surface antigen